MTFHILRYLTYTTRFLLYIPHPLSHATYPIFIDNSILEIRRRKTTLEIGHKQSIKNHTTHKRNSRNQNLRKLALPANEVHTPRKWNSLEEISHKFIIPTFAI